MARWGMHHILSYLLLWSFSLQPVLAVAGDIAAWLGLRGAQIESTIVLEGGMMYTNDSNIVQHSYGVYYQINLTQTIDAHSQNSSEYMKPGLPETSNTGAPNYLWGGIFHNDYEFYTFGGVGDKGPVPGLNTVLLGQVYASNAQITRFDQSIAPYAYSGPVSDRITSGAYTSSPHQGIGYWFGGMASINGSALVYNSLDNDTDHATTPENIFIKVDMTAPENAKFEYLQWPQNQTARSEGALVWLPYGTEGVLVAIGGVEVPADLFIAAPRLTENSTFMTELLVYDIAGQTWYAQETSGSPEQPTQLASFCTAVVPTQDNSSYEIFVYGGYDGTYASSEPDVRDDIWVLSIPAFHWTRISHGESYHGRQGSVCFALNPSTMISIGGTSANGGLLTSDTIVDILDLNALEWTGKFDPTSTTPLTAPAAVVSQLGWPSDGKGPGTDAQVSGLSDSLNSLFSTQYSGPNEPYWPYPVAPSSTTSSTPTSAPTSTPGSSNHWKVPLIAVLCSVIPVLLIILVAFLCIRKRRQNKQGVNQTQQNRNRVFSWLTGPGPSDPAPEKSHTSGETGDTLVDSHPDYFRQHGYKNMNGEIYEAPSAGGTPGLSHPTSPAISPEPYEIMDHSQSGRSTHAAQMSPIMGQAMSEQSRSPSRFSEALPFPASMAARNAGPVPMYELPQEKSDESLPHAQGPKKKGNLTTEHASPTNEDHDSISEVGLSNRGQSPKEALRPNHKRNTSSMSSGLSSLPTPRQDALEHRSEQIDTLSEPSPQSPRRKPVPGFGS